MTESDQVPNGNHSETDSPEAPSRVNSDQMNPETLIGSTNKDSDWELKPDEHAHSLKPQAASLKRVLEHSLIEAIVRRYDRNDADAMQFQKSYKQLGAWEIYLGALAAMLGGAVLLMNEEIQIEWLPENLRTGLLFVQVLCVAGVAMLKYLLQSKKPFEHWQNRRSLAETARVELFETVCGLTERDWMEEVRDGDYPLLPLQLEYFLRYQLGVQLKYYQGRGKEHLAAANRFISFGAVITFVSAFAAGLGGLALDWLDTVSFAAIIAMLAPILIGAQSSLSRLNQDERNAARYAITHAHLDRLAGQITDIRKSARAGESEQVHNFIREVNKIISVEHSQWIIQLSETETPGETQKSQTGRN